MPGYLPRSFPRARAALKPRELYQTRHTFASQLLRRSADISWVTRLMGHANTKMVILRYWKFTRNRSQQDGRDYVAEIKQAMEGVSDENHP
jgi:integrase